jgi:integrase
MALTWADLDKQANTVHFDGIGKHLPRTIRLSNTLIEEIWKYRWPFTKDEYPVFHSKRSRDEAYEFRAAWSDLIEEVELDDLRFRDLRHIRAIELAQKGCTKKQLSEFMGYKSISSVNCYEPWMKASMPYLISRQDTNLS